MLCFTPQEVNRTLRTWHQRAPPSSGSGDTDTRNARAGRAILSSLPTEHARTTRKASTVTSPVLLLCTAQPLASKSDLCSCGPLSALLRRRPAALCQNQPRPQREAALGGSSQRGARVAIGIPAEKPALASLERKVCCGHAVCPPAEGCCRLPRARWRPAARSDGKAGAKGRSDGDGS